MSKLLPESLEGEALLLQAKTACQSVGAPLFLFPQEEAQCCASMN